LLALLTAAALATAVLVRLLAGHDGETSSARRAASATNRAPSVGRAPSADRAPNTGPAPSTGRTPAPRRTPTARVSSSPTRSRPRPTAPAKLTALIKSASPGSVSVAAYNAETGQGLRAGATHGMVSASVVKLEFLETLLLECQRSHRGLSADEDDEAADMMEHSDNDAAEDIYEAAGSLAGIQALETALGLSTKATVIGTDDYWGLTTTSAAQHLVLLHNLVDEDSPLTASSRHYVLKLMRDVETDQRWGVPSAADPDTRIAVKNGWLSVYADGGRWVVNSDGIITVDRQRVLVSVLTQHNSDFADGIAFNEELVKQVVAAVT
jgi:beta-lactamase class A